MGLFLEVLVCCITGIHQARERAYVNKFRREPDTVNKGQDGLSLLHCKQMEDRYELELMQQAGWTQRTEAVRERSGI